MFKQFQLFTIVIIISSILYSRWINLLFFRSKHQPKLAPWVHTIDVADHLSIPLQEQVSRTQLTPIFSLSPNLSKEVTKNIQKSNLVKQRKEIREWLSTISSIVSAFGTVLVPIVLALGGYILNKKEDKRRETEALIREKQIKERALEQRRQDTLKIYIEQMRDLLMYGNLTVPEYEFKNKKLFQKLNYDELNQRNSARQLSKSLTRTVVTELDSIRTGQLLMFISQSELTFIIQESSIFEGINLSNAKLYRGNFQKANLLESNLENAIIARANLEEAIIARANLKKTDFHEANLREANLREANLEEAILHGAKLEEADLFKANLRGADLREASLRGTNLCGASLEKSQIFWANLERASLRGANLAKADLRGTNLRETDLFLTNFEEAILVKASLEGANLEGANLKGALYTDANSQPEICNRFLLEHPCSTIFPEGFNPKSADMKLVS